MRRFIFRIAAPTRTPPDQGFWVTPPLNTAHAQSGLRLDHPIVADPSNPNPNGTYDVKWQATSGKGDHSNPSTVVNETQKITGKPGRQNMVKPKMPVEIDPKDLTPIPNSEIYLDERSTKHNIHVGGGNPSDHLNNDKYIPPGGIG